MPYIKTSKRNQNKISEAQLLREHSMKLWGVPNAKCTATKNNDEVCGRVARYVSKKNPGAPRCGSHS